jgi:hypothetical protein
MAHLFFGPDGTPLSQPQDVIRYLGKGEKHWNRERSAYQTAHSWFLAQGLPPGIESLLKSDPAFKGFALQRAIFENKTQFDSLGRASQTDVLAFLRTDLGPAVLGVEAKVDESFGPVIDEWNDHSTGKLRRLLGLLDRLDFKTASVGKLRYQLFHRTAATLIEAENIGARQAAMIVQSFDKARAGFQDFLAFSAALEMPVAEPGRFSPARAIGGITLRLGWTETPMQYGDR